jgi:uncharacterized membrane protein YraQ (UPF0718 family)
MSILSIFCGICLLLSFIADKHKTWRGILKSLKMFLNLLPAILPILILVSIFLFLLPKVTLIQYLGKDAGIMGYVIAAVIGSIALIPGFIAYPPAGVLLRNEVSYPVIVVFITTLMMVGILTLPIEIGFLGWKFSLLRTLITLPHIFLIAIIMEKYLNNKKFEIHEV